MKKSNPATINHNRYLLLIDWRVAINSGFSTITLEADTLRAAKREVLEMVSKDWYLARILERQNDVGVIDVDTPDEYQWLYRPVLEYRQGEWHDATTDDWSGELLTYYAKYKVWDKELTCDAAKDAHRLGIAE